MYLILHHPKEAIVGPRYETLINPVKNKGCEARIKQQHQNWNSAMCQPKEDGIHQAMATMMKLHEEVFLPSKNETIQHKLMTIYIMGP